MLSLISYRWKLRKLERKFSQTKKRWLRDIDAERKAGQSEEAIGLAYSNADVEVGEYWDQIAGLETASIHARADRARVKVPFPPSSRNFPDDDETWYWSHWVEEPILRPDVRRALLKEIEKAEREIEKAERETTTEWRHWLGVFIAILAVLISLAGFVLK